MPSEKAVSYTHLDRSKIEEQKKAVRAGYDMDIIPSDLATYGSEAKKLLQDLQSRNERMFLVSFLVLNTAAVSYTHLKSAPQERSRATAEKIPPFYAFRI